MPASMREMDFSLRSSKKALKSWIKHRVPVRGDKVLWGKPMRVVENQGGWRGGPDQGPDGGQEDATGAEG